MSEIDTYRPHPGWKPPWKGRTVWLATRTNWEDTEIFGVAVSPEAAIKMVRADEWARLPDDRFTFWTQRAHDGLVTSTEAQIDIQPVEVFE